MKNITTKINEALFETNTWTYLCIGYTTGMNFFMNNSWNPHEVSEKINDKYVIVNSNKDLNTNKTPIINAWKKKYDEEIKQCDYILISLGSKQYAKYIQEIDKAIKKGKFTLEDVLKCVNEYNGNSDGTVEYVYNKLMK